MATTFYTCTSPLKHVDLSHPTTTTKLYPGRASYFIMPPSQHHRMEDEDPEISDTESIIDLRRQVSAIDLASQSDAATNTDLREV